mgnify:FL=1
MRKRKAKKKKKKCCLVFKYVSVWRYHHSVSPISNRMNIDYDVVVDIVVDCLLIEYVIVFDDVEITMEYYLDLRYSPGSFSSSHSLDLVLVEFVDDCCSNSLHRLALADDCIDLVVVEDRMEVDSMKMFVVDWCEMISNFARAMMVDLVVEAVDSMNLMDNLLDEITAET